MEIVFASLFSIFGTLIGYILYTSKRDHKENHKRISKLEENNDIILKTNKKLVDKIDVNINKLLERSKNEKNNKLD